MAATDGEDYESFRHQQPVFLRTKVLTASPGELRLLLLEGAVRFIGEGVDGLRERDYERVYEGFSQARAIMLELIGGLRPEVDPEMCARLQSLYTYIHRLLVDASFEKSIEKAEEAHRLMEFERETWAMLLERLSSEGGDVVGEAGALEASGEEQRLPLSIEG